MRESSEALRIFREMSPEDRHAWMDLAVLDSVSAAHAEFGFDELPKDVRCVLADLLESWEHEQV